MQKAKKQRILFVALIFIISITALLLIIVNFRNNIVFFYSPTELLQPEISKKASKEIFRVGGLVKKGSVSKINSIESDFIISDNKNEIKTYYNKKSLILQDLVKQEETTGIYSFISDFDIFIDNIFFYLQEENNQLGIKKQFTEDYHIEKDIIRPSDEEVTTDKLDQEQYNYQLELEKEFDTDLLEDIQEKNLNKYYKFIDDDKKREGLKYLSELAKSKNIQDKQESVSIDNIIDNFSSKIFEIIDDIIKVIKNDTLNDINPAPSDNTSYFEKYVIIIKNIINILLKEERSLYSGFILIILALLIYFIDGKKENN